ncbi:c-type cytochrome biogenesis protein CcmI/CycH [Cupriavidus sp.]|uniref:c-type cytochrome biogenesis protein CcmI/CycH n=1 Tax=Cupriavidus sp. TaxID=1873897 RepID=UPI003D0DF858
MRGSDKAAANAAVTGTVALGALAGKAPAPRDTVFIFARAVQGPRMPLAVLKRQVRDLPVTFTLDDTLALSPANRLSAHSEVMLEARISPGGTAMPHAGDLFGQAGPVALGSSDVRIVIDRTAP